MSQTRSGFIVGIGSNIAPYNNIALIITELLTTFERLHLSRVLKIPPIGMNSRQDFLNVVVFIETDWAESELKQRCNQIEIILGRDRRDPARKMKDRPADLDILSAARFPEDGTRPANTITDEYFLYPLLDELNAYLTDSDFDLLQQGETVVLDHLTFGQTATTINRDANSSNKRIG